MKSVESHPGDKGVVLAIAAHPDDIEFGMAGTLILLRQSGCETHYLNIASGSCGSVKQDAATIKAIRRGEAQKAAAILGCRWHPSFTDDLEIFYQADLLRRLAAVVRRVRPHIVLTHSPQDYMEDHKNTCRLAVSAAFARGAPNFQTTPPVPAVGKDLVVYHAMPHGLVDELRQPVTPHAVVDTTSVYPLKRKALEAHQSQKAWLDVSQGMDSYVKEMESMSLRMGQLSGSFRHAEGWRRHLHLGFSRAEWDPLADALAGRYLSLEERKMSG